MIKVMIADDQTILAEGIKSVLETSDQIQVTAIAENGADALEKIAENKPDVILLDIRMPKMNGVVTTKEIKTRWPEVKVIILTTFDDSDYILNALNYGASGYLLKDINADSLIDAVVGAMNGDLILPSKIAKKIASAAQMVSSDREIKLKKKFNLSDREVEIALMVYDNFNNRQISSALKISEGTTRNYISAIYVKLNAENRTQAIAIMEETFR